MPGRPGRRRRRGRRRREGGDAPGRGRPWKLSLEDRVLLVAAYWRTNLKMRQLTWLFMAEQSKNYRYSTTHQVVIDADSRLVVAVGRPLPGNRHDSRAWAESGAKAAVGNTTTIADGGYPGTGLVMAHRRRPGKEPPDWKQAHNKSHKQVRARVEHCFARMKTWKILRDCRLRGDGVHHAMRGIARLHNLALTG
ncbi:transposase family protein [Streptomyces sp. NPDC088337]|uniref:transposase family protein n=1 Tax=unclassified Streptomyces TaxID=2593676 RepID=UPI00382551A8